MSASLRPGSRLSLRDGKKDQKGRGIIMAVPEQLRFGQEKEKRVLHEVLTVLLGEAHANGHFDQLLGVADVKRVKPF